MTEHAEERCHTPRNDPCFQIYHDTEWGVPTSSDQQFFEKICLEGFQAGLSWRTVLHRRDALRQAFSGFCPDIIAEYSPKEVSRIMSHSGVIRNERKIRSVLNNAARFQELRVQNVSLAELFWEMEPSSKQRPKVITHAWLLENAFTHESTVLARSLKKMGWSFVGPTSIYATMQALGIVNDHVTGCPCRGEIDQLRKTLQRPSSRCIEF